MPMDFPTFDSLKRCAEMWKFRQPTDTEDEGQFREALADFVQSRDLVESMEIRSSRGWDRLTPTENRDMLRRGGLNVQPR